MATPFSLKVGTFQLATRRSIRIEDEQENLNLADDAQLANSESAGCSSGENDGCTSAIKSKEIVFTARFFDAPTLYNSLNTYLGTICSNNQVAYQRRVCDDALQEETIVRAYMRRVDMDQEFFGIKSGEVHLITRDQSEEVDIGVLILIGLPPSITS